MMISSIPANSPLQMTSMQEVSIPYLLVLEEESSSNPTDVIAFAGISLVLGIACRHFLRGTRVPYTVALLIIGIIIGSLEYGSTYNLGRFGKGIHLWANINPDLLLAVFLPPLLFESSFSMDVHQIKRCMVQMILLAGPGVVISTLCLGTTLKLTFPYDWNWRTSLLLGGLLSATDPVAIVALLKDLGASKKLNTIIEGESLMNDGVAIVAYQFFYRMVVGQNLSFGSNVKFLTLVSLGGVGIGAGFGIMYVCWLSIIFNDTVIEITLTLAMSYLAYFTSQEVADVSGVLTVMTLGVFYAAVARLTYKSDSHKKLHHFWELVAFIANTLIFILSGVIIAEGVFYSSGCELENGGNLWGYLILLYIFVQVSRIFVVGLLYPFLQYFGYGLSWKEAIILIWSGLRGAVALSLALSVREHSSNNSSNLRSETGTLFLFFTSGIVFLTITINGSTTQLFLYLLGMNKLPSKQILNHVKYKMQRKALEIFYDLGNDQELGPADWSTFEKYLPSLQNMEEVVVPSHIISCSGNNLDRMNLKDMRIRLLNGVRAAYFTMLDEGRIRAASANILMQSVDEAIDLVSDLPLCDWSGLSSNVNFPSYYKFLQRSICSENLAKYVAVDGLESACYISAAFLSAHRMARKQLHEFIGECEIASIIINESKAQEEEARIFLEDVGIAFPQLLSSVKTRQVTYSVLKQLSEYVKNLETAGLLDEKEMLHFHYSFQTDIKKLESNSALVKIPKKCDVIRSHPLFGSFPPTFQKLFESSTRNIIEPRGRNLYKEDCNADGFWLVLNGKTKCCSSKASKSNSSLHPLITHGDALGLYEVLCEKSYICDMITDSVMLCFFVRIDKKMLSLLRSDPTIEELLWKESVIVLAKVLFPQIFETLALFDLRTLKSTMIAHVREETMEIPNHSIGFLLEGCMKSLDRPEELITSPAVLLPSHANQILLNASGSGYEAYSGTRIVVFDMTTPQAENNSNRPSGSGSSVSSC